jgi:sugar lactone lactonase YvrE
VTSRSNVPSRITAVQPFWAIEGGRITIRGDFSVRDGDFPAINIGEQAARVVYASRQGISLIVPSNLAGGPTPIRVDGVPGETAFVEVGRVIATGVHQVDNPVFGRDGSLYVTYSGSRGQETPVSVFRVRRDGVREPFVTSIVNPTSMAFDRAGVLHVSSRFEGTIYRVRDDGSAEVLATDLGVATGLAFGPDGEMYVGDRSGTIFRVVGETAVAVATLPESVAAFHLAMGPDDALYVTAPTLSSYDSVFRITRDGQVARIHTGFGRPQGLTFDSSGDLYVVEALAGAAGLYRLKSGSAPERVLAAPALVGVAIDPDGGLVVASNETVYRLDVPLRSAAL